MTRALEEKVAHLDRTVSELSEEVASHDAEIARLTRLVHMLAEREAQREVDGTGSVPLADQRPPHW